MALILKRKLLKQQVFLKHTILTSITAKRLLVDLDKLNKTLEKYEQNYLKFFPSDFKLKSDVNATQIASVIRDFYFKDVPEDEKMGHMIKVSILNATGNI